MLSRAHRSTGLILGLAFWTLINALPRAADRAADTDENIAEQLRLLHNEAVDLYNKPIDDPSVPATSSGRPSTTPKGPWLIGPRSCA